MKVDEQLESDEIDKLLKGRTMSVYALLLTREKIGVRDVQRELGFSSPSLALHHLMKLSELGLVDKNPHGEYYVIKTVRAGSLSLFVKIGKRLLPRFLFLATLFTAMLILYILFFMSWPPKGHDIMYLTLSLIAIGLAVYESRKLWLLRPF
jgi:hypothetical protein